MKLINYFNKHPLLPEYCFGSKNNTSNVTTNRNNAYLDISSQTARNLTELSAYLNDMRNNGSTSELLSSMEQLGGEALYQDQPILRASALLSSMTPSDDERCMIISSQTKQGLLINQPNVALMCLLLCLGTFLGAYYLRIFRNSHYLGRSARRAFGDFGVPISIVVFVLIDYLSGVKTEKLLVPEGISPTMPGRDWFVLPGNIPLPVAVLCCVPALLAYILVFMETQISELVSLFKFNVRFEESIRMFLFFFIFRMSIIISKLFDNLRSVLKILIF